MSRTNIQANHANLDSSNTQERPCNPGLWKLLAAAAVILVMLVVVMEVFEDTEQGGVTLLPAPHATTH
ncbi:hypothetical protein [Neorhizobium alkalisoli]|uniref:hypothetical protein n=1 Tax=Neorhizobium alkalisoli TaxID=528178 RepID=UPI001AEE91CF|nr:hypothetical protein [Neorhizobium alkalisoli]